MIPLAKMRKMYETAARKRAVVRASSFDHADIDLRNREEKTSGTTIVSFGFGNDVPSGWKKDKNGYAVIHVKRQEKRG